MNTPETGCPYRSSNPPIIDENWVNAEEPADEELPINVVLPVLLLIVVVFALASFGPKRIMSLIRN